ncbi:MULTISPECIES: restriction endonuclease subunit S [Enterobacteriaceae]|uniref:restriction endonuclease subunit S n=1 Tax=Enterobacteriaceae TaxID=543 RepID=UPI000666C878|nr:MULTISPECIES: restriction endonuclease subunit S [Enterobacteriaceae]NTY82018.1 restriction endonuclease subunit S [Citrobacter werkmanii]HBU8666714.1 restriction endonuclease subunit S [Klebsiella oxytoca]HBU8669033.1 restriction endonuclease subunit S [Klebsiella oxytoca]
MNMEKKVPDIRFNGFDEEWNGRCLGSLCLIGDIDHRMPESKTTGIPYLMTGDFCGINGLDFKNAKLISIEDYEQLSKKIKPEYGDILFARYASVGSVRYVETKINFLISYSCAILKTSNTSYGKFLFYFFQTNNTQKKIELDINTGSQRNIGIDSLKNLMVFLPKSEEQIFIGNYLQKLDNLINQHQQKYDKLSNIKKAMLEKMFPKQGKTIPEIRFKGFNGNWDEIELGKEVTFINGRAYSQEELQDKGKYKILRVGNFYTNSSWYYSDMELGDKYYTDYGDLLYTWSASFGPHIWYGDKVIYHYHIWKLELSENIEKSFLLHLLDYDKAKILSGSNGSTMIHITKSAMEAKKVFIPKKDEQAAIGNYFQKLDALINQHQQQITKLNNIKQACLSKMFV